MIKILKSLLKEPASELLYRYFVWRAKKLLIFPKGPILIIAPHPDDESFGCGAFIASHPNPQDIHITIMTDGGASTPSSNITSAELAAIRKQETLNATQILGIPKDQVDFLNYPDGAISMQKEEITSNLTKIIETLKPTLIIAPFLWDKHKDHSIIAKLIQNIKTEAKILHYPLWFWPKHALKYLVSEQNYKPYKLDARPVLTQKEKALHAHKSQYENITGSKEWDTLDSHITKMALHSYELYFTLPTTHQDS